MNLVSGDSISKIMVICSFPPHTHGNDKEEGLKKSGAENRPDKDPVPKPGNGSVANKQLTGQLCITYLAFTFTFAAFIISSWKEIG